MPWDETELWLAELDGDGRPRDARRVAGGSGESIFQPEWSPGGVLHFVSDRSGWWNLYRLRGDATEALCPRDAEFGLPQWAFGMRTYAFAREDEIVCCFVERGEWRLARLPTGAGRLKPIDVPFVNFSSLVVGEGHAYFVGGAADRAPALIALDLASDALPDRAPLGLARARPGLRVGRAGDRVPDQRRPHGVRLLLPAREPRSRAAAGRAAAAARALARRSDRGDRRRAQAARSSTGRAAASPCSTSTMAAAPATAAPIATGCSAAGAWSTSRTASRARATSPRAVSPTPRA